MKTYCFFFLALVALSCKLPSNPDKKYSDDANTTYHLRLNPAPASVYHYDIVSTTEINMEVDGKEVDNLNRSTAGINYTINKDSSGNYIFAMNYDKLKMYANNGETETESDADNGRLSLNPTDKLLAILKDASLSAVVSPEGQVQKISGYNELSDQILSTLPPNDINARQIVHARLDKLIGGEMVQRNLDQMFKIFPDSAVRIGDKWKINNQQKGEFSFETKSSFRLKDITNEVALITSETDISSDNTPVSVMGYNAVPVLKGTQQGKYEIETKTGMLINSEIESDIKGSIQIQGREIPIKIKITTTIDGKKIK